MFRTPIDDLEPLVDTHTELRDFAIRSVEILHAFAVQIEYALAQPDATLTTVAVAFFQAAYALGLPQCEESMTVKAAKLGVERATISKGAVAFCAANDLQPSWHMKKECSSYTEARIAAIEHSGNGNGNGSALPTVPARGSSV